MVRWVVRSILHGVDPLNYFSFQPVLHDWCIKGRGMCYPVCGMVHIKEPLLLIGKNSPCGGSGFPLSLSEWSFTNCPTPYNRKIKCVESVVKSNISFLPRRTEQLKNYYCYIFIYLMMHPSHFNYLLFRRTEMCFFKVLA